MRSAAALLLLAVSASLASAQTPAPQTPADQKAFRAARAIEDPDARIAALRKFIVDYPKSNYKSGAEDKILDTLVEHFPDREKEIDAQAKRLLKGTKRGAGREYTEGDLAETLAAGGPKPVDLKQAEKWARDDADRNAKISKAEFSEKELADYKKYKQPAPTPAEIDRSYNEQQAGAVLPLADVLLRKGDLLGSAKLLDRAGSLDPQSNEVNRLKGELALAQGDKPAALADFEKAELTGDLKAPLRAKMAELYREAHGGSDAGMEGDLDTQYAALYPPPSPTAKQPPANGHTVLLELFTGSACGPCVGGDVAVETALAAYPRSEVVALAFDQHIPEPDPLANADSTARADGYDAHSTPNYFLDGAKLPFYGGGRSYAGELYTKLSKAVDAEAARPSGVRLSLADTMTDRLVEATASVTMPAALAPAPPAAEEKPAGGKPAPKPAALKPPVLAVQFALVEDEVRYSGENGIRFHRMVVRSMAAPQPLALGASKDLRASFDLPAVSDKLHTYLTDYQTHNDRFGKVEFLSLNTTLNPKRLAIAAWVEDTANHRVLEAAFQPVSAEPAQASLAR